jgi:hypothetical protein
VVVAILLSTVGDKVSSFEITGALLAVAVAEERGVDALEGVADGNDALEGLERFEGALEGFEGSDGLDAFDGVATEVAEGAGVTVVEVVAFVVAVDALVGGAMTFLPLKVVKPRKAASSKTSESATFEDFLASSAAFLYEVESASSAVAPVSSSIIHSDKTRTRDVRERATTWRTFAGVVPIAAAISSVLRPSISHITSAVR